MSAGGSPLGFIDRPLERGKVDVLFVSLGSTLGLQAADEQLVQSLRSAGLSVHVAQVPPKGRNVRTLMLTDLVQAWVSRVAAGRAMQYVDPAVVLCSTTTAALLAPRADVIRFDALAQRSRPGRHGVWQRPLERRRLRRAKVLLPWDAGSLDGAPDGLKDRTHVVPVAIDTAPDAAALGAAEALLAQWKADGHRVAAVTYAADAAKKGLDRLVAAWGIARRTDETLIVTGRDALPSGLEGQGILCVGRLDPAVFRALVGAVGLFAIAPRREDYGLVQLEALAAGARVVTTTAPGPYAALPLIRELWPEQVVDDADDPSALAAALRVGLDARADPSRPDPTAAHAQAAVGAWSPEAVRTLVEREIVPLLRP
ncbi:MAG: glycosyltransferase [Solirubrobacteraceae bacterium]|nr:glycosyltransferase [Solirubrobacteraceae bacterium]